MNLFNWKPGVKRAVVLAGGGSRGAYQVGVWRGLRTLRLRYQIVTGSSVGSLNGALMVTGQYKEAVRLWENISNDLIMKNPFSGETDRKVAFNQFQQMMKEFVEGGGMDVTPLEEMIKALLDETKLRRSRIQYGIVTVHMPDFKPVELFMHQIPQGELVDYMLASAACFPAFRPKTIQGHRYIDGGYTNNLPIDLALRAGATEIIAVDLDAIGIVKTVPRTHVPITYIRSYWPLGNFLHFHPDTARRNMELGYLDCMKAFGKLDGWAYTFQKGCLHPAFDALPADNLLTQYAPLPKEAPKVRSARKLEKILREGRVEKEALDARERFMAAGEWAGELLGLPATRVWSRADWYAALHNALADANAQLGRLEYVRMTAAGLQELVDTLKGAGPAHLLAFVCRQLGTALKKEDANALKLLEMVMPKEFIAGLYLIQIGVNQ